MADIDRSVMVVTPPLSENGSDARFAGEGCPISGTEVNNSTSTCTGTANQDNSSTFPPSPVSSIKSRRDRNSLLKEEKRSRAITTRLQRSSSTASSTDSSEFVRRKQGRDFRRQTHSLPADHGLKAIEPPHEQALTKMAFAEQQKWITVQQKTFTKWYELAQWPWPSPSPCL
jgi:hypothetical protein